MALKGTTKIELTNVKTGQKEVIEKNNLVTNAVADILALNPFSLLTDSRSGSTYPAAMTTQRYPLCPNLFGGILLYGDSLEEDANRYYAPYSNPLIGYSSNNVNETTDVRRGSMNLDESGVLDDGSGYRFVFDFATSQANGTISALGLTSKWGGLGGYKSAEQYYASKKCLGGDSLAYNGDVRALFGNIYRLDPDTGIAYACQLIANNTISVGKFQLNLHSMPLVGNRVSSKILEQSVISTEVFGTYGTNTRYAFLSDGEGNIWGFQHAGNAKGNSSGDATINWIKINPDDWSFEEGTWTLPLQLNMFGYILQSTTAGSEYSGGCVYSIIKDGFLFCLSYDLKSVYKIQLSNITNIKTLKRENGGDMAGSWPGNGNWGSSFFCEIGNAIVSLYCTIENDVVYEATGQLNVSDYAWQASGHCTSLKAGPYVLALAHYGGANQYAQACVSLVTPYLATINNLPTPVEKTADKTMKITYILREES